MESRYLLCHPVALLDMLERVQEGEEPSEIMFEILDNAAELHEGDDGEYS